MDWNLNNLTLLALLWSSTAVACALYVFVWSHRALGDEANERSLHKGKVLTSGGLFVLLPWLMYATWQQPDLLPLYGVWLMLLVGLADDVWHWSAKPKFLLQCVVALLLLFVFKEGLTIPLGILIFFALVWWLNLYNFMDGANGIAGLHVLVVLGFYAVLFNATGGSLVPEAMIWALLGSVVVFLFFNLMLGRLFLGDAGSLPLAFVQAWLALIAWSESLLSLPLLALLHASFAADATFTLIYRFKNKEAVSQAHNTHFYQRWVKSGATHGQVALAYAAVTAACAVVVYVVKSEDVAVHWTVTLGAYLLMAVFFIKTLRLAR